MKGNLKRAAIRCILPTALAIANWLFLHRFL